MKYVVCIHLYIPWKFGERGSTPRGARRPSLSVCLFVCPSRYDARHRKPRRCVYALNLGGTGISPPDSYSYRSSFRFRSRSSSSSTTSGDIFYCSSSRQLNHSSLLYLYCVCNSYCCLWSQISSSSATNVVLVLILVLLLLLRIVIRFSIP